MDAFNGYDHLFKKSKGQIISLLDSDDFFKKNKIARIVKLFDLKKDLLFVQNLPIEINKYYSKKKIIKIILLVIGLILLLTVFHLKENFIKNLQK